MSPLVRKLRSQHSVRQRKAEKVHAVSTVETQRKAEKERIQIALLRDSHKLNGHHFSSACPRAGWVGILLLKTLPNQCNYPAQGPSHHFVWPLVQLGAAPPVARAIVTPVAILDEDRLTTKQTKNAMPPMSPTEETTCRHGEKGLIHLFSAAPLNRSQ